MAPIKTVSEIIICEELRAGVLDTLTFFAASVMMTQLRMAYIETHIDNCILKQCFNENKN